MVVFAVGFIAAALSSMLTVALGAAITADTVYSDCATTTATATGSCRDGDDDPTAGGRHDDYGSIEKNGGGGGSSIKMTTTSQELQSRPSSEAAAEKVQKLPRWAYQGMMWLMVLIATAIVSANGEFLQLPIKCDYFLLCIWIYLRKSTTDIFCIYSTKKDPMQD